MKSRQVGLVVARHFCFGVARIIPGERYNSLVSDLVARIKGAARELGFELVGIARAEPLGSHLEALLEWCERGFAADMSYMTRRPEMHADPSQLMKGAASIITLAVNYYAPAPEFEDKNRYGRVARYAWGRDYHDVIKPRLVELATRIERMALEQGRPGEFRARCFVDAVPLLERAVAERAGLGFFGKNTNLLQPRRGSWFFLAEILINIELPVDQNAIRVSCGTCCRCLDACPTGAFAGPYWLDSRRCISYLTIENKGPIPFELRRGLGHWVFGCDVCQEVCPFNRFSVQTDWPELGPEAGVGPRLDLVETLAISSDEEFRARFRGTALSRPKRRGLLRNAAVVAANVGCTAAIPALVDRVERDPEPLIRGHALWALSELEPKRARELAKKAIKTDPDESVRREADLILANA